MRLGGPIFLKSVSPELWIAELQRKQFRAAYAPVGLEASASQRNEYRQAAREADVVIAEVGAWSNPLSSDSAEAAEAFKKMVECLRLADDLGARCCVNIAGSCGIKWDGPAPDNLTQATFDRIVAIAQRLLSEVAPTRAGYALEPMPWIYPDSAESYLQLVAAIDHPQFMVHYDPVNMINSPGKFFRTGEEIDHFIDLLGDRIRVVHAKDTVLADDLTTHLNEAIPGTGGLDYGTLLTRLDQLDPDIPVMTEHLDTPEQYDQAAAHIRRVASDLGISV